MWTSRIFLLTAVGREPRSVASPAVRRWFRTWERAAESTSPTEWRSRVRRREQRVALYNFVDTVRKRSVCGGRCRRTIGVFLVHASGRSVVAEAKPQEVLEGRIGPSAVHREVVGLLPEGIDRMELYRRKVREAHFAGVPIRNCFLCRYHGLDGIEHAIFCKLHKQSWQSNTAVECEAYRPLGTPGECARVDAANDAYVKQNRARRFRWYTWNI